MSFQIYASSGTFPTPTSTSIHPTTIKVVVHLKRRQILARPVLLSFSSPTPHRFSSFGFFIRQLRLTKQV